MSRAETGTGPRLAKPALTNCQCYKGASRLLLLPGAWLAGVDAPCVLSGITALKNKPQGQVRPIFDVFGEITLGLGLLWLWDASQQHPELSVTARCWAFCDSPMPWLC